jgi:hypothetical protein
MELAMHVWRENVVAHERLAVKVEAQRQWPGRVPGRVLVADPRARVQVDAVCKVGHIVGTCVAQVSLRGGSITGKNGITGQMTIFRASRWRKLRVVPTKQGGHESRKGRLVCIV